MKYKSNKKSSLKYYRWWYHSESYKLGLRGIIRIKINNNLNNIKNG